MNINSSANLNCYYKYCRKYNNNRDLKYQLRTEINTGHLMLVHLCENMIKSGQKGNVLLTNLYSLSVQSGQSVKTITRHLKSLKEAGIILQHGKRKFTSDKNLYKVEFNPKLIISTRMEDGKVVFEGEEMVVENVIRELFSSVPSKSTQLSENEFITC